MLQQTQVERVIPYYKKFIKKFPTVKALARAPLSEVLIGWQGLGYNRRAKMLHKAAKELVAKYKGKFPTVYSELVELPGIGPYTARAVAAFAFNQNVTFVETNIRTVVTHHFFAKRKKVSDKEIEKILVEVKPRQGKSREWYSALMDYGAHLKKSGVKLNRQSKHYTKQSKFSGSPREARGAILKSLSGALTIRPEQGESLLSLLKLLGTKRRAQMRAALHALEREGLVKQKGRAYTLAT